MSVDRPDDDDIHHESADSRVAPDETTGRGGPEATEEVTGRAERLEAHAELRVSAADAYRAYTVDRGCDRIREVEETVTTPAMRRVEAEDLSRTLVGLEFRL